MLVAMVLVDMIDAEKVRKSINERLMAFMGRPINGELFCAITDTLVEAINEELKTVRADFVSPEEYDQIDKPRRARPMFMCETEEWKAVVHLHDEVIVKQNDDRAEAMLRAVKSWTGAQDKLLADLPTEPKLMKEWPTTGGVGPMTTSVAYCCRDRCCPSRAPISAQRAPICYTCGKFMEVA